MLSVPPTVFLPSNTPVCPNYNTVISLLSLGVDILAQFLEQFQNLTQMYLVKSTNKGTNTNNEFDILIESLEDLICILEEVTH